MTAPTLAEDFNHSHSIPLRTGRGKNPGKLLLVDAELFQSPSCSREV